MKRRRVLQLLMAAGAGCWSPGTAIGKRPYQEFPATELTDTLVPLFPLDLVLLPESNLGLHIFEPRYKEMIQDCLENSWDFGILLDPGGSVSDIGCTASIVEILAMLPDGRMNILVRGERRFETSLLDESRSYLRGEVQFLEDVPSEPAQSELRQQGIQLHGRLGELLQLEDQPFPPPAPALTDARLSYRMMAGVPAATDWKQGLLELRSEPERLIRVIGFFEQLIEYLESLPDDSPGSGRENV